jgi:two-component system, cell cycle response regulator DivK
VPDGVVARWRRFPLGTRAPLPHSVATAEAVWVKSEEVLWSEYPEFAAMPEGTRPRSLVAIPLTSKGHVLGGLALGYRGEQKWDPADRAFLLTVATLCAQALERSRSYEAESEARGRAAHRLILELAGYRVIEAETGRQAIRLARRMRPMVVLMEVSPPIVDGLEATRRLKSDPRTAKIPIVLLMLSAGPSECEEAERAGCDGYLVKPCSPQSLLAEIHYHNRFVPRGSTPAGIEAGLDGHSRGDCTHPPGMWRDSTRKPSTIEEESCAFDSS